MLARIYRYNLYLLTVLVKLNQIKRFLEIISILTIIPKNIYNQSFIFSINYGSKLSKGGIEV